MKHANLETFGRAWIKTGVGLINTYALSLSRSLAFEVGSNFELIDSLDSLEGTGDLFAADRPLLLTLTKAPTKDDLLRLKTWRGRPLLLIAEKLKIAFEGELFELLVELPHQKQKRLEALFLKAGKKIETAALRELETIPEEFLAGESEKLITYVGERESISLKDLLVLITKTPSTTVWAFLEALLQRKKDLSLRLGLTMDKESFFGLMKLVRSQVKNLLILKNLESETYSHKRQALAHLKDRNFSSLETALRHYSEKELEMSLMRLDRLDFQIRNGLDDYKLMMTQLVLITC